MEFQGNSKIVEIVDSNVEHDPPYFVMRYYPAGDLTTLSARLKADIELQEETFSQMIDCLAELHSRGKFHRDVKPQNFLVHDDGVVVSDFGLSKELVSADWRWVGVASRKLRRRWRGLPAS